MRNASMPARASPGHCVWTRRQPKCNALRPPTPKLFLCIIFGFVLFSIGLNLYRMSNAVSYRSNPSSAVERQEQ